jgi:uncharacterized protein YutE (UPF0331/DUF86 family)
MKPRKLDDESILSKLGTMRRLLRELESMGEFDHGRLESHFSDQLVAERVLTALVDLASAINTHVAVVELNEAPHDLRTSFRLASRAGLIDKDLADRLAPSTGMRNVLIHAYMDLDIDKFLQAIPMAIEQYGRYVEQVARWLLNRQERVREDVDTPPAG